MRPLIRSVLGLVSGVVAAGAVAAPIAGDIAIIGRIKGTNDEFAFVTLKTIDAGESIYFTDNGWSATGFRHKDTTSVNGGAEELLRWTTTGAVAAGTIINSRGTAPNWAWSPSTSGIFGLGGTFAPLDLATAGDQIYAFLGNPANPLRYPTSHLYAFDDTGEFEDGTDTKKGDTPPGLSVAARTAVTLPSAFSGAAVATLKTAVLSGTHSPEEWLALFSDKDNWRTSAISLPTGAIHIATPLSGPSAPTGSVLPEPSSLWLLGSAALWGRLRKPKRPRPSQQP